MLLQDFDFHNLKKINKINDFLKENFGFSLDIEADKTRLTKIKSQVSDQVVRLKIQENMSPKDPELTKNLLILEGVELLIHRAKLKEDSAHTSSRRYLSLVDGLAEFVTSAVEVGDDLDDAINQAMKEYRSSKWRFPDYEVEYDLRQKVSDALQQMESMYEMGLAESEEADEEPIDEEEDIEEAGLSVDPREPSRVAGARGGSLKGRKSSHGKFATPNMDQTGRNVADPESQKNADSYLKKHGSIDWDNVGLADEVQNPTKYKTKEAGLSVDPREPSRVAGARGGSLKGRKSTHGKFDTRDMDKTGRAVADPARQKKADSYLKKHGSIDWDNVGLQDDAWGKTGMDKSGRYAADPSTQKKAGAFLKKGPKAKGDVNWDNVSVQGQAPKAKPKAKAKPGRGQKAVFDLPEKKGR